MAKKRNYKPPVMLVRQHFTDDETRQAVPALVHISGPHANFVSSKDATAELGRLGTYTAHGGLHVELPRCLVGNTLDRDSVVITLKNAYLRYFKTTSETFLLPKGNRNAIVCSPAMQASGFSFKANGPVERALVFQDRDVQVGDAIRVTANVGGEAQEFVTTVAAIKARYTPGIVLPTVTTGTQNTVAGTDNIDIVSFSEATQGVTVLLEQSVDWYEPMLKRGIAEDTYLIEVLIGGNANSARFRVTSASGDNLNSLRAVETGSLITPEFRLPIGSTGAYLLLTDTDMFTTDMQWTVKAEARVTSNIPVPSGVYLGPSAEMQPREVTYIVTVSKGGEIPTTEPTTDAGKYACPTLSVTTTDGSDKMPVVRVLEQGKPVLISRFGVELTFNGDYLIQGDKFLVTCRSAYSDIFPTIVLNRNVPNDWIDPDNDTDVSLELFIVNREIEVPEYSMTTMGRVENWTLEMNGIWFREDLTLYTPGWTIGGVLSELPVYGIDEVKSSQAYMSMRYFVPDLAHQIVTIRSRQDLNDLVSGPIAPENPLKYAAYWAMNNGAGSQVLLTGVADPNDLDEWEKITDIISERDDVFHVFPLTGGDKDVNELFYKHVKEMNQTEVAKERVLYLVAHDPETVDVLRSYQGQPVVGKISVETSVGSSQYTAYTVETPGVDFLAAGVKAGDTLRTRFDFDFSGREVWTEYKVTEVVNAATLRLDADPLAIVPDQVAMSFEIWRTQNNNDYADSIAETGGFNDMLVRYIYTDNADPNFSPIGPAAALVGLIGSVVPHQGVTWYPLEGFDTEGWTNRFSNSQLNHMAGNGVLLITKHADGYICARHAVTTFKSPLDSNPRTALTMKMTEEMFVRNGLLVKKEYRSALRGFVGIANNSPGTRLAILANINMKSDQLKNDTEYPTLGGRITAGPFDLDIRTHSLFRDHVLVWLRVEGPVPLNSLECDLFI